MKTNILSRSGLSKLSLRSILYAGLAGFTGIALFTALALTEREQGDNADIKFIDPPLQGADIIPDNYTIDALNGGVFEYWTGTKISIPDSAIVDENGTLVTGEVIISYREFHDPVDFFFSGIPMDYDSAGVNYIFKSAGMMEILAYKNDNQVFLKPDEEIDVEMASYHDGTEYNLYELDTNKKNWVFKGKDRIHRPEKDYVYMPEDNDIAGLSDKLEVIEREVSVIKKNKPVKPRIADRSKWSIKIIVDPEEFPEIAVYKNTLFEITEDNIDFDPSASGILWENVELMKTGENEYVVRFSKYKRSVEYRVQPVFDKDNYDSAKRIYDSQYAKYIKALSDRRENEKLLSEICINERRKLVKDQVILNNERRAKLLKRRINREEKQRRENLIAFKTNKIYRLFSIEGFGVHNCDEPEPAIFCNTITVDKLIFIKTFNDQGQELNLKTIYFVEKGVNRLNIVDGSQFSNKCFDPDRNYIVWSITKNNKFALCHYNNNGSLKKNDEHWRLNMEIIDIDGMDVEAIKSIINPDNDALLASGGGNFLISRSDISINVYPNPFRENVNVQIGKSHNYKLSISDLSGKIIRTDDISGTEFSYDLSDLKSGIYLIKVSARDIGFSNTVRIIKE